MLCKLLKSIAPILMAALLSIPAAAQIPAPPVPNLEIRIAHTAPPRPRHERISPRPGEGYVWIAGNWDWQGSQWTWVPGRWDRPEQTGVTWVRPRYVHEYGSFHRYEPGHWSHQRIVEGDDYRHWKENHHHGDRDRDRDRDHEEH